MANPRRRSRPTTTITEPDALIPAVCSHLPGQEGCDLNTCQGIPTPWPPLDRNEVTAELRPDEGVITGGQHLTQALEWMTGMKTAGLRFADNGWSDTRPGARHLDGWEFTIGTDNCRAQVRILAYRGRRPLSALEFTYAAVYVGRCLVDGDLSLDRPAERWVPEIAPKIAELVEGMHDAVVMAQPLSEGERWRLKSPPAGYRVDLDHEQVTVVESRIGGFTLLVRDPLGRERFVDRTHGGWWSVYPPEPLVHVRSSSPTVVDYEGGRQGLANPTWCGRVQLPAWHKAWHNYNLKPELVTCPVCHHMLTCVYAQNEDTAARDAACPVCAHIYGCEGDCANNYHAEWFTTAPGLASDQAPVESAAGGTATTDRPVLPDAGPSDTEQGADPWGAALTRFGL